MYHMVRIMTGTLLEVGTGEREASMIPVVIAAEDRSGRISGTGKGSVFKKSVLLMPLLSILKMEDKNRRQEHRRLK